MLQKIDTRLVKFKFEIVISKIANAITIFYFSGRIRAAGRTAIVFGWDRRIDRIEEIGIRK